VNELIIVAEFRPLDDESDSSDCYELSERGCISECDLKSRLKSKSESLKQFYLGILTSKNDNEEFISLAYSFNNECISWHYSWKGNRYKQRVNHVFMVSVLLRSNLKNDSLRMHTLLGQFCSPSFCILSLRRRASKRAWSEFESKESADWSALPLDTDAANDIGDDTSSNTSAPEISSSISLCLPAPTTQSLAADKEDEYNPYRIAFSKTTKGSELVQMEQVRLSHGGEYVVLPYLKCEPVNFLEKYFKATNA